MTPPDLEPPVDSESKTIKGRFQLASNPPETLVIEPLLWRQEELTDLRRSLKESGLNLEITDKEKELLKGFQFRSFDEARGIGVAAVLGKERSAKLVEWSQEVALESGWTQKFASTEPGLGLRQAVADTLTIAVLWPGDIGNLTPVDLQTIARKIHILNQRVWLGYVKKYRGTGKEEVIREKFEGVPKPEKPKMMAGIPAETLIKVLEFLTS